MHATQDLRPHADTALPPVVDAEEWQRQRDALLVEEKANTRARDAIAAKRRRLPMFAVEQEYQLQSPEGPRTLLDLFEGRRQLIVYHHMLKPDDQHPCPGCSAFTDHVPHLAHLQTKDITLAFESAAPVDQFADYMVRMGRPDIPVYSSAGTTFRQDLNPSPWSPDSFGLSVFLRSGDQVFYTYGTHGRGVDGVPLFDMVPYGRQEAFEDSPEGWPQRPTYSFGAVHWDFTEEELAGLAAPSTTGQVLPEAAS